MSLFLLTSILRWTLWGNGCKAFDDFSNRVCSVQNHGHNIFLQVLGFFSNQSLTQLIAANNFDVFFQHIGSTQEPGSSQQKVLCCFKSYIGLCLNGAIGCGLHGTSAQCYGLQVFEPTVHFPPASMLIGKLPWHAWAVTERCVYIVFLCSSESPPKIIMSQTYLIAVWCTISIDCCYIYLNGQCLKFSEKRETIQIQAPTIPPGIWIISL